MAKCGCSGQACSCALSAGANIEISGTGSATNPFRISARPLNVQVSDTGTINMTLTGDGSTTNPFTISADLIGSITPTAVIPAESRSWSGSVSLTDVTGPRTIRVAITGNVTAVAMPTWSSSISGSIYLMISQDGTGSRTWVMPGTSASGTDIVLSTAANARDLIECFWTGVQWVLTAVAKAVA